MPKILAKPIDEPCAWTAADFANDESWIEVWTPEELGEIDRALKIFQQQKLNWYEIDRDSFALPKAGERLKRVAGELENGRGFVLLRGLPIQNYTLEETRTIYWGLGSYIGEGVSQNAKGHLIASVKDQGYDFNDSHVRGYVSHNQLTPHCDPTDVVGLLCFRKPLSGGISTIASSMAVYNRILEDHPEYLESLYTGYHYNLRGEGATGDPNEITFHKIPIYSYLDGRLSCRFNGNMIRTAQDLSKEHLTDQQIEVLDFIEQTATSPEYRFDMALERGDIQFLCNHSILHTRSEFIDGEGDDDKRHLLRLWLYQHHGRKLEPHFADRYNTGPRGGCAIMVSPDQREYAS